MDFVKFDGCDQPEGFTAEQLTCNMSNALLNTGTDFWFNFHCWHTDTCAKCGTSYRVFDDHHDEWKSTSSVIKFMQKREPFWGPDPEGGWPDMDFVYTGGQGCNHTDPGPIWPGPGPSPPGVRCPGQTIDEYVSEFSIWALAGGQIVISSDPRNMTAFQKHIWFNKEVIAVFKDVPSFKDVAMIGDGGAKAQVWIRPTSDGGCAVVLHNPNEASAKITVTFGDIPKRSAWKGKMLNVRDLWAGMDLPAASGSYSATVPKHGSVMIKLTAA